MVVRRGGGGIVVVDYHKGNLQSVVRGLLTVGADAVVSDDPRTISQADGIVVPGVGSLEDAMLYLLSSGEGDAIAKAARAGTPVLGICLGMHLLFDRGQERSSEPSPTWGGQWVPGLGLLRGSVTRLESSRLKVPHVGWDQIHLTEAGQRCPLFVDVPEGANLYFTHSFALCDDVDPTIVATRTHYVRSFASAVWADNIYGVQFHPEKSSGTGMRVLSNFVHVVEG